MLSILRGVLDRAPLAGALNRFEAQPPAAASQWDRCNSHANHTQD